MSGHTFGNLNRHNSITETDGNYDLRVGKLQRNNSECRLRLNEDDSASSICSDHHDDVAVPVELRKTVVCFILMVTVLLCNLFCSTILHDYSPMQRIGDPNINYPPLRDIIFDFSGFLPQVDAFILLTICEVILLSSSALVVLLLFFHKNKSVVFRRHFFLIALLFSARLITMNVTMLPISSKTLFQCDPKSEIQSGGLLLDRFTQLLATGGVANVKFCGNYVYSGHAVLLILNCLMTAEYCRSYLLNLPFQVVTTIGVFLILVSGFDYTISVIIAYYVTTRLFWVYHTLANDTSLKNLKDHSTNQICKVWWYPIFNYVEGNVHSVITPMNCFIR